MSNWHLFPFPKLWRFILNLREEGVGAGPGRDIGALSALEWIGLGNYWRDFGKWGVVLSRLINIRQGLTYGLIVRIS